MDMFETVMIFKPEINLQKKLREYEQVFKNTTDRLYFHPLGIKKLAYDVKKYKEGHYVVFYYRSNSHWVNTELDLKLRQDDDVLKFMSMQAGEVSEEFDRYTMVELTEQNKRIDAMDVLLGLASYNKEVK